MSTKEDEANLKIAKLLFNKRFIILAITGLFVILGAFLFFITPKKYSAEAVFMTTASNNVQDAITDPAFGYEFHADQAVQLLKSQKMRDLIVEKYDLMRVFEVDSSKLDWRFKLNKKFDAAISFSRTPYLSIEIKVLINEPQLAADIANSCLFYYDSIRKDLYLSPLLEMRDYLSSERMNQKKTLDSLLTLISEYPPVAFNSISETRRNELLFKSEAGNREAGDELIKNKLESGSDVALEQLITDYYFERNILYGIQGKLSELNLSIEIPIPMMYEVSRAVPDGKPTSPKLIWHLIFGFIAGLVFSVSLVLGIQGYSVLKEKLG